MAYLPSGKIPVVTDAAHFFDDPHAKTAQAILFDETRHHVNFTYGEGGGYDAFLDHAVLLTREDRRIGNRDDLRMRDMLNVDAHEAAYGETLTIPTALERISEDTWRYFDRTGRTRENIENRLAAGFYEDTLATCCGEPGCGSSHALIRGGRCEVLFHVNAASLDCVEFFPFRLDAA